MNDVLQDQLDFVIRLLQRAGRGAVYLPTGFEAEHADSILGECKDLLHVRIQKFKEINDEAAYFAGWVSAPPLRVPFSQSSSPLTNLEN